MVAGSSDSECRSLDLARLLPLSGDGLLDIALVAFGERPAEQEPHRELLAVVGPTSRHTSPVHRQCDLRQPIRR